MNSILEKLVKFSGKYIGTGINHDNQEFEGFMNLIPLFGGKGMELRFTATGLDKTVYHEELTILSTDDSEQLNLWTINNNVPFLYKHTFKKSTAVSGADHTLNFLYNNPEDKTKFREEITLDLWPNGDISYRYSWGMPGGDFKARSGLRLKKLEN